MLSHVMTYRILVPPIVHVLRHLAGQVPHLISLLGDGFVSRFAEERLQIKPSSHSFILKVHERYESATAASSKSKGVLGIFEDSAPGSRQNKATIIGR